MRRLWTALLVLACAPASPPPWTPTATFAVTGARELASSGPVVSAVASETRTDTFTRRHLRLVLADLTAGTLTIPLVDNEGAATRGTYVVTGSPQLIERASWENAGVRWEGSSLVEDDPSVVTLTAVEWTAGGRLSGTFSLELRSPSAASERVNVSGAFDVALTQGP
jgi:hypothetical protein